MQYCTSMTARQRGAVPAATAPAPPIHSTATVDGSDSDDDDDDDEAAADAVCSANSYSPDDTAVDFLDFDEDEAEAAADEAVMRKSRPAVQRACCLDASAAAASTPSEAAAELERAGGGIEEEPTCGQRAGQTKWQKIEGRRNILFRRTVTLLLPYFCEYWLFC
jgi:hypothetical protein